MFVVLIISIYSLHSNILNSLFELLDCQTFDKKNYLRVYLTINCEEEAYNFWMLLLIIPGLIFYAVFVPFFCLAFFYKIKKNIFPKEEKIRTMGFLIGGYQKNKYYW